MKQELTTLAIAGVVLAGMAFSMAAQAATHAVQRTAARAAQAPSGALVLIQGRVVAVQGSTITVHTPDVKPSCAPGEMCPTYVIAGMTFKVDTSHAIFQSAIGQAMHDKLAAGEAVIVVGTGQTALASGVRALRATVIARNVMATARAPLSPITPIR